MDSLNSSTAEVSSAVIQQLMEVMVPRLLLVQSCRCQVKNELCSDGQRLPLTIATHAHGQAGMFEDQHHKATNGHVKQTDKREMPQTVSANRSLLWRQSWAPCRHTFLSWSSRKQLLR